MSKKITPNLAVRRPSPLANTAEPVQTAPVIAMSDAEVAAKIKALVAENVLTPPAELQAMLGVDQDTLRRGAALAASEGDEETNEGTPSKVAKKRGRPLGPRTERLSTRIDATVYNSMLHYLADHRHIKREHFISEAIDRLVKIKMRAATAKEKE